MERIYPAIKVDKNSIPYCKFPKNDIHFSATEVHDLVIKLKLATILGNMEKVKCKIFFEDEQDLKYVETTIWATCEKNIVLKSGICIPIRRIFDVII